MSEHTTKLKARETVLRLVDRPHEVLAMLGLDNLEAEAKELFDRVKPREHLFQHRPKYIYNN